MGIVLAGADALHYHVYEAAFASIHGCKHISTFMMLTRVVNRQTYRRSVQRCSGSMCAHISLCGCGGVCTHLLIKNGALGMLR
jgi:hypothetical protein